jgi:hypothetical protein
MPNLWQKPLSSTGSIIVSLLLECPKLKNWKRNGIAKSISQTQNKQVMLLPYLAPNTKFLKHSMHSW